MKKILLFFAFFCMFFSLFAQKQDNQPKEQEEIDLQEEYDCQICYYATQDHVNLRLEPNTHCKILGELFIGDEVYINKRFSVGKWLFCYVPKYDIIAYCSSKVLAYKPFIYELVPDLLKNDSKAIEMVKEKKVLPYPMDLLISNYLKNEREEDCIKIVKLAYDCGCDYDSEKSTSLIQATNLNYFDLLSFLLTKEVFLEEIDTKNNNFGTPLFHAIYNGNVPIAKLLLENDADPNEHTIYDWTMFETIDAGLKKQRFSMETAYLLQKLLLSYDYDPEQDNISDEERKNKYLP